VDLVRNLGLLIITEERYEMIDKIVDWKNKNCIYDGKIYDLQESPWQYILNNFFADGEKNFFIDIGAYDGSTWSNTFYMESELNWDGICIEPHPVLFDQLMSNRKCKCYNACIADKTEDITFLAIGGRADSMSGIEKNLHYDHKKRIDREILSQGGSINRVNMKSITLNSICSDNNINKIGYLSIDTEGSEINVLKGINFNEIDIRVISAENNGYHNEVKKFLLDRGYNFIKQVSADEIFVKL
jgi:FkbM family methyltransferase